MTEGKLKRSDGMGKRTNWFGKRGRREVNKEGNAKGERKLDCFIYLKA